MRLNTTGAVMAKGHMVQRKASAAFAGVVHGLQRKRNTQTLCHQLLPCRGSWGRLQKEVTTCVPLLRCQVHGIRGYQEVPQHLAKFLVHAESIICFHPPTLRLLHSKVTPADEEATQFE